MIEGFLKIFSSETFLQHIAVAQGFNLHAIMRSHSGTQASCFDSLSSPDCCGGTTNKSAEHFMLTSKLIKFAVSHRLKLRALCAVSHGLKLRALCAVSHGLKLRFASFHLVIVAEVLPAVQTSQMLIFTGQCSRSYRSSSGIQSSRYSARFHLLSLAEELPTVQTLQVLV